MFSTCLALLAILLALLIPLASENSKAITEQIIKCWLHFYTEDERAERFEQLCADFIDPQRPFTSLFRALCFGVAAVPNGFHSIKVLVKPHSFLKLIAVIHTVSGATLIGIMLVVSYGAVLIALEPDAKLILKILSATGVFFLWLKTIQALKAWWATRQELRQYFADYRKSLVAGKSDAK
tara:strand:- start:154 stop:693 length:540 start_codon:yes stop_codon:yes gene_type:complete